MPSGGTPQSCTVWGSEGLRVAGRMLRLCCCSSAGLPDPALLTLAFSVGSHLRPWEPRVPSQLCRWDPGSSQGNIYLCGEANKIFLVLVCKEILAQDEACLSPDALLNSPCFPTVSQFWSSSLWTQDGEGALGKTDPRPWTHEGGEWRSDVTGWSVR